MNSPTIGVIAFTIFPGGGLQHFLNQALKSLACSRPTWKFKIFASIALQNQIEASEENEEIWFWDDGMPFRFAELLARVLLTPLGKQAETSHILQNKLDRLNIPWGNYGELQKMLSSLDLIWVPYYTIAMDRLSLYKILRSIQTPVLLTIHDIHPAFFQEDYPPTQLFRFYQEFIPFARKCNAIITHSNFQRSAILKSMQVTEDKVTVTPQPPLNDPIRLTQLFSGQQSEAVLDRFDIHEPYAFYPASTLHTHKNHIRLLDAWRELYKILRKECPLLVFTAKGNRQQWRKISSYIKSIDLMAKVRFTGIVDNKTLSILYQNCGLVVLPTLYEGAGSGILTDGLTVGKPVICSRIPQIIEQLDYIHGTKVSHFNPYSVPDIVISVTNAWNNISELNKVALQNKTHIVEQFSSGWNVWKEAYIGKMQLLMAL